MKPDSNLETDRLLQRFAALRRELSVPGGATDDSIRKSIGRNDPVDSSHLDADELISYAENALPSTTRLRYTRHLSDCDSCRKLVTELVMASGMVTTQEPQITPLSQVQTKSWRDWLGMIFAPRVLRYAASVILLVGIASVALVVYQSGWGRKFDNRQASPESASEDKNVESTSSSSPKSSPETLKRDAAPANANLENSNTEDTRRAAIATSPEIARDLPREAQKSAQEQSEVSPPAPPATTGGVFGKPGATVDKDAGLADRRQPARGVDAAKMKKEAPATNGRLSREAATRAEADDNVSNEGPMVAQKSTTAADEEKAAGNKRARSKAGAPPADSTSSTMTEDSKSRADSNKSDTSVVAGKQFIRRNGAWVDIDYRSQATTNVKRGSDQYRALVADEPGLKTIANQLSGVVVVVWKSRAYRIH